MFHRRTDPGPDPWIKLKIALFALAGVAVFLGVRLGMSWLVWVAVGLLLVSFTLRFAPRASQNADDEDGPEAGSRG